MRTIMPATSRSGPPAARSARKVRSSLVYCNEKYACSSDRSKASFTCEQCRTDQCEECELRLHELTRYTFHDRRRIVPPPADRLCDPPGTLGCQPRNLADLICQDCNWRRYCFDCDLKTHRGKPASTHRRVPADSVLVADEHSLQNDVACLMLDNNTNNGCVSDNSNSSFVSLTNTEACEVGTTRESLFPIDAGEVTSLLYVSLPNDADGLTTAVNCVQPSSRITDDNEPIHKRDQSPAAIFPFEADEQSKYVTASLQGSILSPQFDDIDIGSKAFQLADHREILMVSDAESFMQRLQCEIDAKVKVVSVFGKTGEGKSYALNHTFFGGNEMFSTVQQDSSIMTTCTNGVWAALDPVHEIVLFDTAGWLGISATEKLHMRHLLKIFAVSDVVIIQTKSEHLHSDIFHFLANASSAYQHHVSTELTGLSSDEGDLFPTSAPEVVIFHETCHADLLAKGASGPAEKILRSRFKELGLNCDAIKTLQYVGTQTTQQPTDFKNLLFTVKKLLQTQRLRSPREPAVIFKSLKKLYDKFSGSAEMTVSISSEDNLCLTCKARCLSCSASCRLSMNHDRDGLQHTSDRVCEYQKHFDNQDYLCKACFKRGHEVVVIAKASAFEDSSWFSLASYAWSGYVLECTNCGVIYRSRQHWFGNVDPDRCGVLKPRVTHVWPGTKPPLQVNVGRHILDSLSYVSDVVVAASSTPAKVASSWVTDRLAPAYWVPNCELSNCHSCDKLFDTELTIHHCRACGQGFCDKCTSKRRSVPERGWGLDPVRVCDSCFNESLEQLTDADVDELVPGDEIVPRRVGEVIGSTIGTLASAVSYPFAVLRDAARPEYWTPDDEITACCVCSKPFDSVQRVHHCRACGQGVCDKCSPTTRSVPSRGWHYPVRVCKACDANM